MAELEPILKFVEAVGLPGAISVGLLFILYKQTSILNRIDCTLQGVHEALLDQRCPLANKEDKNDFRVAYSQVHPSRYLRSDRRAD